MSSTALDRAPTLTDRVAEKIVEDITAGRLGPGDRLVETKLAERYAVSRGPVREALRTLEGQGLVESGAGAGSYVVRPTAEAVRDAIVLRAILEGAAARLFAAAPPSGGLQALEATLQDMRRAAAAGARDAFLDCHWRFHELVASATGNELLLQTWSGLRRTIRLYTRLVGASGVDFAHVIGVHDRFLALFRAGDAAEAEAFVRGQIVATGFRLAGLPLDAAVASLLPTRAPS